MAGARRKSKAVLFVLIASLLAIVLLVVSGYNIVQRARLDRDMIDAVHRNDTEDALFYLTKGADPNARVDLQTPFSTGRALTEWFRRVTGGKATVNAPAALSMAIDNENSALTRALITGGADVNVKMENEEFPLLIETLHGDQEFVQMLLERGAHPNAQGQDGTTALWSAALYGRLEIARMLLTRVQHRRCRFGWTTRSWLRPPPSRKTSLWSICSSPEGANVNAHSKKGQTALYFASLHHYDHIVHQLRQAGAKR